MNIYPAILFRLSIGIFILQQIDMSILHMDTKRHGAILLNNYFHLQDKGIQKCF